MKASAAGEEGFSLLEVVIALGIMTLAGVFAMSAVGALRTAVMRPAEIFAGEAALNVDEARLRTDAETANTIAVTAGALQFGVFDQGRILHVWSYAAAPAGLVRSDASGPQTVDSGLTAFAVRFLPTSQLTAATEITGPMLRGLQTGSQAANVLGGTLVAPGIFEARLQRGPVTRLVDIAVPAMVTNFGVQSGPVWRALISRTASTHRFAFGFGQRTTYTIHGQINYSYDGWKTQDVWCAYDVRSNLENGDPGAETDSVSKIDAKTIFEGCKQQLHADQPPPILARERLEQ